MGEFGDLIYRLAVKYKRFEQSRVQLRKIECCYKLNNAVSYLLVSFKGYKERK